MDHRSPLHPLARLVGGRPAIIGHRKSGAPIYAVAGGAPNALLERAVKEREGHLDRIDAVSSAAFEGDRDLSDQDQETIARARERIEFLEKQIETLSISHDLSPRARQALESNGVQVANQPELYRSVGQAAWDLLHRSSDRDAAHRLERAMSRAAQHIGTTAEGTVPVAGGVGALVVKPVVGPVIDIGPKGRPFLNALGVIPMDSPLGFHRPRIVDTAGNAVPDVQAGGKEKAELPSRAFNVKLDSLETETIGEYLNISQQALSIPANTLGLVLNRFTVRRQRQTERRAIAELLTTTSTVELASMPTDGTRDDARVLYEAIWEAAELVWEKTGELPTWILMGPKGWRRLGQLVDKADRPLFPSIGAANAMGSGLTVDQFQSIGPAGLPAVVSFGVTDDTFVVGNDLALEVYEYAYPMLESIEASVLGRQIATAVEVAYYQPATDETPASNGNTGNAAGNGAVKIVAPAAP